MGHGRKLLAALFAIGTFARSLHATVTGTTYEVTDIGALTGMPYSVADSVSNTGYVVGGGSNGVDFQQAFIWSESTGLRWLGSGQSFPGKVNDSGQVIGTSFSPSHGTLWNADGSVAHFFDTSILDQPTALNNAGQVTGYRKAAGQTAYVWNGSYLDLGFPPPAITSQGYDINNNGVVAGNLGKFAATPTAFVWSQSSGFTTIATSPDFESIITKAVSDQITVVGSGNDGIRSAGWKWNNAAGFSILPSLPGDTFADARDVNDSDIVVGYSGGFGTIWDEHGNIHKANDLLAPGYSNWNITALWSINDDGWLTGEAIESGSTNSVAVLLRPIPEPASSGLIMLTCASLLARRRRGR